MRNLIIGFVVFLAACNGSNNAPDPRVDALQSQVKDLTQALAAATHETAQKFSRLQIIGQSPGGLSLDAGHVVNAVSFGTCPDMGVLIGFTNANSEPADGLSAIAEDFKQCTGYVYSIILNGGAINTAQRLFWDGPNCTGNPIEWQAAGAGYNTQTLESGVVFASPVDGSILMVRAGQTPQPILIQSVWVASSPGCQSDVETQLMYTVEPNDVSVSGVPDAGVGKVQLGSP